MILNSLLFLLLSSCDIPSGDHYIPKRVTNTKPVRVIAVTPSEAGTDSLATETINTKKTKAEQLVDFAETLKGITYQYGASDPRIGFDCSGFISYVFNHFEIRVPRASKEFTYAGREIKLTEAKRGDLILFTGTDSTKRVVGHMGIITANEGSSHQFIHSTSGKAYGVTSTPLNKYYQGRFVKVIRIFKEGEI